VSSPYTATNHEFWDSASVSYDEGIDDNARVSLGKIIETFHRNDIIEPGIRILDIGCGTGELALALAHEGADVTAMDFSEGMLKCLDEKLSPELRKKVTLVKADWQNIDLTARNWIKLFDLAVASMTPALRDPDALFRMQEVSNGWCFLKGWAQRRRNMILEGLWPRVMKEPRDEREPELLFQFNLLFAQGYFPLVSFEEIRREKDIPLSEAIEYYLRYFSEISPHPESRLRTIISKYLTEISKKELIHENSKGWTGTLLWHV
jgi:SAM-dependent methyltransferase